MRLPASSIPEQVPQCHPGSTPSHGARAGLPDHRMGAPDHVGRGQGPPELLRQSGPGRHEDLVQPLGNRSGDTGSLPLEAAGRPAKPTPGLACIIRLPGLAKRQAATGMQTPGQALRMFLPLWTRQRRMADTCPEGPPDGRTQCPGAVRHEQAAHGRIEPPAGRATCQCPNRGLVPGSSFHHSGGMLVSSGGGADGRGRQEVVGQVHAIDPDDQEVNLRDVR